MLKLTRAMFTKVYSTDHLDTKIRQLFGAIKGNTIIDNIEPLDGRVPKSMIPQGSTVLDHASKLGPVDVLRGNLEEPINEHVLTGFDLPSPASPFIFSESLSWGDIYDSNNALSEYIDPSGPLSKLTQILAITQWRLRIKL